MVDKLKIFILDDNIPKTPNFVEDSVYDGPISSEQLNYLLDNIEWKGQQNLQQLTSYILRSEYGKSGDIEVWGFTHPSLCLDSIDTGLIPDIIIYDWEYGIESHKNSSKWLTEILNLTSAFIFVYSLVRDKIPLFLNKPEYEKLSARFQLFLKGSATNSVFSSEEFILQYALSRISKTNVIKIQGVDITFKENSYLENPTGILFLEKILGRLDLINSLEKGLNTISNDSIESLLNGIELVVYHDTDKNLLVTSDSQLFLKRIKTKSQVKIVDIVKNYGLKKLMELLEIGIVKVD